MRVYVFPLIDLSEADYQDIDYYKELHHASFIIAEKALLNIPIKARGLEYHNRKHTEDVLYGFIELGSDAVKNDRISLKEFYLGIIAAVTHDLYYEKELAGTGENESRSTDEALKLMKEHKIFTPADMERVAEVHQATVFKGAGKDGIVQNATEGDYLEELVTDIDTGGIGMKWPEAKERIDNFYREINEKEPDENDPDYLNFLYFQVDVLTGHSFKTQEGSSTYAYLTSNVEKINKIIARITN